MIISCSTERGSWGCVQMSCLSVQQHKTQRYSSLNDLRHKYCNQSLFVCLKMTQFIKLIALPGNTLCLLNHRHRCSQHTPSYSSSCGQTIHQKHKDQRSHQSNQICFICCRLPVSKPRLASDELIRIHSTPQC